MHPERGLYSRDAISEGEEPACVIARYEQGFHESIHDQQLEKAQGSKHHNQVKLEARSSKSEGNWNHQNLNERIGWQVLKKIGCSSFLNAKTPSRSQRREERLERTFLVCVLCEALCARLTVIEQLQSGRPRRETDG
jgi:hypothetical protein